MDLGIAERVALVTASSKGLGRAAALTLAREGARVVICARDEGPLRETEEAIENSGGVVAAFVADVTEPEAPQRLVDAAVERFGSLDILVANAGGPPPARALEADDAAFHKALNDNLLTSIRLVRSSVVEMRRRDQGRICLVTSWGVRQPIPGLTLSNTARTGLLAWAKTAAQDLIDDGITLNLICPGPHSTDRALELGLGGAGERLGSPDDFGEIVAFLCSRQAAFISGTAVQVDGAQSVGLL